MTKQQKMKELRSRIGVGQSVAAELLTLSGDDVDMAAEASLASVGLDQCKAAIIDKRFKQLEKEVF